MIGSHNTWSTILAMHYIGTYVHTLIKLKRFVIKLINKSFWDKEFILKGNEIWKFNFTYTYIEGSAVKIGDKT